MILVEDMVTKADFLRLLYKRHQFKIKGSEFFNSNAGLFLIKPKR